MERFCKYLSFLFCLAMVSSCQISYNRTYTVSSSSIDFIDQGLFRSVVQSIWVEKVVYTPQAASLYPSSVLNLLEKEILDCGFGCVDSDFRVPFLWRMDPIAISTGIIQLVPFSHQNQPYSFVMALEKNKEKKVSASIFFLPKQTEIDQEALRNDFLLGRLIKIATLQLPVDEKQFAIHSLTTESNYRRLFHLSQYVLAIDEASRPIVKSAFIPKISLYLQCNHPSYQLAVLEWMREAFSSENSALLELAQAFFLSKNEDLAQLSAITLAEHDRKTAEIKNQLRRVLHHSKNSYRKNALLAFYKIRESVTDEIDIISKMMDDSNDIRQEVIRMVATFSLKNEHLSVLQKLLENSYNSIRKQAVEWIGKINTEQATASLLPLLGDSYSSIADAAWQEIQSRPILLNNFDAIKSLSANAYSSVRLRAILLLGKMVGPKSTELLIELIGDSYSSVQDAAAVQLEKRALTEAQIPLLQKHLENSYSRVRLLALSFLKKINSSKINEILISLLVDSSNTVRAEAEHELTKQALSLKEVPMLQKVLQNDDSSIRRVAVKLIGKIAGEQVTHILISLLEDSSASVRTEVVSELEKRSLSDQNLTAFQKVLQNDDSSVRLLAIDFISKIKSKIATNLLISSFSDSSSSVFERTFSLVKSRTLDDELIPNIEEQFQKNNRSRVRLAIIELLEKIGTPKALDVLSNWLLLENGSSVQNELKRVILQLKRKWSK